MNNDSIEEWRKLLAQCDLVQGAVVLSFKALLEAYRLPQAGNGSPSSDALLSYKRASAMRAAAERALLEYLQREGAASVGPDSVRQALQRSSAQASKRGT